MSSRKTTLIRVNKRFRDLVKLDHPDLPIGHVLEITYLKHPLNNANVRIKKIKKMLK